jgi:CHASE2 domain-containing sensor protein
MIFVVMGNPELPLKFFEEYGVAWHHIPEIFAFSFLGIWLGSLGYLSRESLTYHDSVTLLLVGIVGLGYAQATSYLKMFPVVLTIVFIPSFFGYFLMRLHSLSNHTHKRGNRQSA